MPLFGKKRKKQTALPKEVLLKSRVIKNPRVVSEKHENGTVVLKIKKEHTDSGGLFSGLLTSGEKKIELDEIGSYVWELIEKEATVESLVEALAQKFSLHWKEAETSLLVFLNMLLSRGLISLRAPKTLGKER